MAKSVEPQVVDITARELNGYRLRYFLEQESLNTEIDKALEQYISKQSGSGGNRCDIKLLITSKKGKVYPVIIEAKGHKNKLEKLDAQNHLENINAKGELNFKNINGYAANGAVHYANAIVTKTETYKDVIAIGVTGYEEDGEIKRQVVVYSVTPETYGIGRKIGEYENLAVLKPDNFEKLLEEIQKGFFTKEELSHLKEKRENEITASLTKLNNDIYKNEKGLSENDRVYIVAASIISTLSYNNRIKPLTIEDLRSSNEHGNTDGDIMIRKIDNILRLKNMPAEKHEFMIRTFKNVLLNENLNKPTNNESQLKRIFIKINEDLGRYYKSKIEVDFAGKLFNEMYSWLGFTQDKLNDVVLTPSYVSYLLVNLARINRDSYVWDFATGSAGLLVAAMNTMLKDAKDHIFDEDELLQKELNIKANQLLGIEILPNIYMLSILNMLLMGDGSSQILNEDSLEFRNEKDFKANAFILNPPYSAAGNGMIFVQKGLNMMKSGYGAIIIQASAGSGKAKEYCKKILKNNTLLASIKMPTDLFSGKASVQTQIYVFKCGEPHDVDVPVKFIDFTDDGYTRSNRKKASNNLKDTGNAKEKYEELAKVVKSGPSQLHYIDKDCYYESTITLEGDDWNQSKPVDIQPTLEDFKKTVADYLSWEVNNLIKSENI